MLSQANVNLSTQWSQESQGHLEMLAMADKKVKNSSKELYALIGYTYSLKNQSNNFYQHISF